MRADVDGREAEIKGRFIVERVGILTGGGDSSGINAVLRAVAVSSDAAGWTLLGIKNGWRGLLDDDIAELTVKDTEDISHLSGTILGTSRTNPYKIDGGVAQIEANLKKNSISSLIAIGGDDTLGVAGRLAAAGLPVVGIPQTIDNDIYGTDYCVGFDTAVNQCVHAVDALVPSNQSHQKDMIVEVMGRENGWITLSAALAVQADYVVIPERPLALDHMISSLRRRKEQGRRACLVLVAEGIELPWHGRGEAVDAFGNVALEGVAHALAAKVTEETDWQFRVQILGFIQRGGRPSALEMKNSIEMGQYAMALLKNGELGFMVARRDGGLTKVPLQDVPGKKCVVPDAAIATAEGYGCFGTR